MKSDITAQGRLEDTDHILFTTEINSSLAIKSIHLVPTGSSLSFLFPLYQDMLG